MNKSEFLREASRVGRRAFEAGKISVPARDSFFLGLLAKRPSDCSAVEVLKAWSEGWHAANLAAPVPPVAASLVDGRNGLADFIAAALTRGTPLSDKARSEMMQSLPHLRGQMGSRLWADEHARVVSALFPEKD